MSVGVVTVVGVAVRVVAAVSAAAVVAATQTRAWAGTREAGLGRGGRLLAVWGEGQGVELMERKDRDARITIVSGVSSAVSIILLCLVFLW